MLCGSGKRLRRRLSNRGLVQGAVCLCHRPLAWACGRACAGSDGLAWPCRCAEVDRADMVTPGTPTGSERAVILAYVWAAPLSLLHAPDQGLWLGLAGTGPYLSTSLEPGGPLGWTLVAGGPLPETSLASTSQALPAPCHSPLRPCVSPPAPPPCSLAQASPPPCSPPDLSLPFPQGPGLSLSRLPCGHCSMGSGRTSQSHFRVQVESLCVTSHPW